VSTTIVLVRHCAHELLGECLVGRRIDVSLSENGIERAGSLAVRLARQGVTYIKSSPRLRALQTARPLARKICRPIVIMPEFDELDFGDWAGRTFDELQDDPHWQEWNSHRGAVEPPRGESMHKLQTRVIGGIFSLVEAHKDHRVVVVSHAEPIRAAILYFRQIALDDFSRVQVDPGSLTSFDFQGGSCVVHGEDEKDRGQTVPA
jgi:probable phosphoglycerate mutase